MGFEVASDRGSAYKCTSEDVGKLLEPFPTIGVERSSVSTGFSSSMSSLIRVLFPEPEIVSTKQVLATDYAYQFHQ